MEKVTYLNQPNCYRISNDVVDLIVTTDIGPRIIRYGLLGEENILGELPNAFIKTELGEWRPFGGHRLWLAPENKPRSYAPDNSPIGFEVVNEHRIRLTKAADVATGIEKEIIVTLDENGSGVTIAHTLRNKNPSNFEVSPWAITIMNGGGVAILPQEPYRSWDEYLLPARPMVLWHYTDLSDPRWTFSKQLLHLRTDAQIHAPQKIGIANKQGWAAYHRAKTLFVKSFDYQEGAHYPDYGCNTEVYTAGSVIEIESLGPVRNLAPGEGLEQLEYWQLFADVESGTVDLHCLTKLPRTNR